MGWGNESTHLAELKRHRAAEADLRARVNAAEAKLASVQRLLDRYHHAVPRPLLVTALADRSRCAICISPYVDCEVHS